MSELYHYGIKGQRWNVRRYQNEDGSLTSAGRIRYGIGEKMRTNDPNDSAVTKRVKRDYNNLSDKEFARKYQGSKETYRKRVNKYGDPYMNAPLAKLGKKLAGVKGKKADKYARDEIKKIDTSDVVKTNKQKKIAKMTPEARKEMNEATSKILLGVGLGIAALTTLKAANAVYKTCKNIKVASDQFKSDYNSKIIDSDDWDTIGKIKFKDIGYDQDWTDEWRRERGG